MGVRALGAEHLAREDGFHRHVVRQAPGQAQQPAGRGGQAALDLGKAELGRLGDDDQVAGQHGFKAAGQGIALHGRNQRLARRLLREAQEAPPRQAGALALQKALQVHTGAERAARAGDDAHLQRGVAVQLVQRRRHGLGHLQRGGVARLGVAQRHDQHVAAHFDPYRGCHHKFLSVVRRVTWPVSHATGTSVNYSEGRGAGHASRRRGAGFAGPLASSPFPEREARREKGLRGAAPSLPAQAWTSPKRCRLWRLHGGALLRGLLSRRHADGPIQADGFAVEHGVLEDVQRRHRVLAGVA